MTTEDEVLRAARQMLQDMTEIVYELIGRDAEKMADIVRAAFRHEAPPGYKWVLHPIKPDCLHCADAVCDECGPAGGLEAYK